MSSSHKHKVDEENIAILREAAAVCSAQAVRMVRERGLVLTVAKGGCIVQITPEGEKRLKPLASSRLALARGTLLAYR